MNANAIKVNRTETNYAWSECECGNTIKFGEDESFGVCPQCSATWVCTGDEASRKGDWPEDD